MPGIPSLQDNGKWETMLNMVDVLLELGGDLSRVNIVGNDFVAIAGNLHSACCPNLICPGCAYYMYFSSYRVHGRSVSAWKSSLQGRLHVLLSPLFWSHAAI